MINFNRWFNPVAQHNHQVQESSIVIDTIVTVALSSLALLTAQVFDRSAPGMALLLRCSAVSMALVWLFKRCWSDGKGDGHQHYQVPPVVIHHASPPSPPRQRHYSNWSNWLFPQHVNITPVNLNPVPPSQVYGNGFPKVNPITQPQFTQPQFHVKIFPKVNPVSHPQVHPTVVPPLNAFPPVYGFQAQNGPHMNETPLFRQPNVTPLYEAPQTRQNYPHSGSGCPLYEAPMYRN